MRKANSIVLSTMPTMICIVRFNDRTSRTYAGTEVNTLLGTVRSMIASTRIYVTDDSAVNYYRRHRATDNVMGCTVYLIDVRTGEKTVWFAIEHGTHLDNLPWKSSAHRENRTIEQPS